MLLFVFWKQPFLYKGQLPHLYSFRNSLPISHGICTPAGAVCPMDSLFPLCVMMLKGSGSELPDTSRRGADVLPLNGERTEAVCLCPAALSSRICFFSVFAAGISPRECLAGRLMNQLRADLKELPDGVLISLPDRIVAHCFQHVKNLTDYFLSAIRVR